MPSELQKNRERLHHTAPQIDQSFGRYAITQAAPVNIVIPAPQVPAAVVATGVDLSGENTVHAIRSGLAAAAPP